MSKRTGRTQPHPGRRDVWRPLRVASRLPMTSEQRGHLVRLYGEDAAKHYDDEWALGLTEIWKNDVYTVHATKHGPDEEYAGLVYELSIRRNDRGPARDWRDFQRIKNEIAGEEIEAVEIYPRMSRIMDTANQYFLWCFPPGVTIPVGFNFPRPNLMDARDHDGSLSEQRELPEDWKPLMTDTRDLMEEMQGE